MDLGLRQKVVLVTGASRGIGKQIALAFAEEGAHVAVCSRNRVLIDETVSQLKTLGVKAHGIASDLNDDDAPARVIDEVEKVFGRLNILINNAGSHVPAVPRIEGAPDHVLFERVTGKGFAAIRLARAAIPCLRRAGWGRVIFIGGISSSSLLPPNELPIATSSVAQGMGNALLSNFSKHLSLELAADNISVNIVHPHLVKTDRYPERIKAVMADRKIGQKAAEQFYANLAPIGRAIEVRDVADMVVFLASERAGTVTGQAISVAGGAGGHIPY